MLTVMHASSLRMTTLSSVSASSPRTLNTYPCGDSSALSVEGDAAFLSGGLK